MSYVFRIFQKSLKENQRDWFPSEEIADGIIDSIEVQETDGKKTPTSIPSPFAQIDLIRSAFKAVNSLHTKNRIDLDAHKDVHRLVSNALDIGQLFFNYKANSRSLDIECWERESELAELRKSSDKHAHLADTLELFLSSADAKSYNFDALDNIFILKYNNRVIGGTSPKTLFFASADALEHGVEIHFDGDRMLDTIPRALYKRNKPFIRYMFYLQGLSGFGSSFPEVNDYLDHTLKHLDKSDLQFANELRGGVSSDEFDLLALPGNTGVRVKSIPGFDLLQSQPKSIKTSDFFISTLKEFKTPHMALPVDKFTMDLIFAGDEHWDPSIEVPYRVKEKIEERIVPRLNVNHPWVTISDFLEDTMIELPYKQSSDSYLTVQGFEQFLLPLNKNIFKYFTAKDLIKNKMISMLPRAGGAIEVRLEIPIQNRNKIQYVKLYKKNSENFNRDGEIGNIVDANFTLGVYPFVASKDIAVNRTVACAERNDEIDIENLSLLNSLNGSIVESKKRSRSDQQGLFSNHYLTDRHFDVLQVKIDGSNNLIVPKFESHTVTANNYHFAIDFGTTNTHIEFINEKQSLPKPYVLEKDHFVLLRNEKEELRGRVKTTSEDCEALLKQELIDNTLGEKHYTFPFRSVILENESIDYSNPVYLYGDVNIGFDYEKISIRDHLTRRSGLKWLHLDEDNNNARVEKFIRQLLELCKNKVLHKNGEINKTTITWMYPTSMTYDHRNKFEAIWKNQFEEVFPKVSADNLKSLPESIAPFYYYQSIEGLMNQTAPTISIDIGGGTSDITIFEQNNPKIVSSFKFAGQSIFGDGYNSNIQANGFVKKYYPRFKSILEKNSAHASNELKILNDIYSHYESSDDLSNFLFSLEENFNLNSQDIKFSYSKELTNDADLKIIFILFYGSICYHIAQLMKHKGLKLPKNVLFSGTASKTIDILDKNKKKLTLLFNKIFDHVYQTTGSNVSINTNESPKVLTAKGALKIGESEIDLEQIMYVFYGEKLDAEGDQLKLDYGSADQRLAENVVANLEEFFELIDSINSEMSFSKSFGASSSSISLFKKIRKENLIDYALTGIEERKKDVGDDSSLIDETLFFYPLVGLLNRLASEVVN